MARKRQLPIGVDLGFSAAKFVQLQETSGGYELLAAAEVSIPEHLRSDQIGLLNHLGRRIPDVMREKPFRGRRCRIALPASSAFVRHVHIPPGSPDRVESAVRSVADTELPYPVDDAVVRHILIGDVYADGRKQQEVILVAIQKATLDAYITTMTDARLEIGGISVEPMALINCYSRFMEDPEAAFVVLDLGSANVQVTIGIGSRLVFYRSIPGGGDQVNRAIAQGLKTSAEEVRLMRIAIQQGQDLGERADEIDRWLKLWADAAARDIDNCLRYFESMFRDKELTRLIFTGGQARDTGLCRILAEMLELPAQIGDPMTIIAAGKGMSADQEVRTDLAVGIGLCLGESD